MKAYRIVDRSNSQLLREFLIEPGSVLASMVQLIEVLGQARIEAVLQGLVRDMVGQKQRGWMKASIRRHRTRVCSIRRSE